MGGGDGDDLLEVNYVIWFDVTIERKIERERLEFGFKNKDFPKTSDDFFHKFEDICTSQSHKCSGRVMGVLIGMREKVKYDSRQRCLIDLIDKFGDAHILDSGWREANLRDWQIG